MRVELDEVANELIERPAAIGACNRAGSVLAHRDATGGAKPSATHRGRKGLARGTACAVHEGLDESRLHVARQAHVAALAGELTVGPPFQNVPAPRAKHKMTMPLFPPDGKRGIGGVARLSGAGDYEQPDVVPQLTHLWQLPLGIMIDPHSGQVGASVRAMKL